VEGVKMHTIPDSVSTHHPKTFSRFNPSRSYVRSKKNRKDKETSSVPMLEALAPHQVGGGDDAPAPKTGPSHTFVAGVAPQVLLPGGSNNADQEEWMVFERKVCFSS